MLTLEQQGILVVCALGKLAWPGDIEAGRADRCCPACCAQCALLKELLEAGVLTTVVKQAPEHMWGDNLDWWKDGQVDADYLRANWACTSWPPCGWVLPDIRAEDLSIDVITTGIMGRVRTLHVRHMPTHTEVQVSGTKSLLALKADALHMLRDKLLMTLNPAAAQPVGE